MEKVLFAEVNYKLIGGWSKI